jgi:ACS family hexuronate transporter-like MFS transporter
MPAATPPVTADETPPAPSGAPGRWWVAGLLVAATTINYIDRQAIAVAAPAISGEFGLSALDYAWIPFAFLLAYAVMQVVAGAVVDRIGPRRGLSLSVVVWSLASAAHALATGVWSLVAWRVLLAIGEAGNFPAAIKAIARWFPVEERSLAVGWLNVGPGLGAVMAPPAIAALMLLWGWRGAFLATGLLGVGWWALWWWTYPPEPPNARGTDAAAGVPWRALLARGDVWGLLLARFVSDGAFYFVTFWLPTYLATERGFGIAEIGLYAWMPFLAADLGAVAGGWLGARALANGVTLRRARLLVMWLGAVLVVGILPARTVASPYAALAWFSVAMLGIQVKASSLFTMPADLCPTRYAASLWGLTGAAGSLGGMAFQPLVGWLIDRVSYAPVFAIVATMHLVSCALVVGFVPQVAPIEDALDSKLMTARRGGGRRLRAIGR